MPLLIFPVALDSALGKHAAVRSHCRGCEPGDEIFPNFGTNPNIYGGQITTMASCLPFSESYLF